MPDLKLLVDDILSAILIIESSNIDFASLKDKKNFYDFKERKFLYLKNNILKNIKSLNQSFKEFSSVITEKKDIAKVKSLIDEIDSSDIRSIRKNIEDIQKIISRYSSKERPRLKKSSTVVSSGIPKEISAEINADLEEINKCFQASCFRSVVILCGRILETALHRKYYDATKNDLLEKAPGIGLGKIIAKLEEQGIKLGPGLTQQIHLINQVRIYSVHKKSDPFYPSRNQAEAIYLFTQDILDKIF